MEIDERVWLKHKETGGFFEAPKAIVEDYAKAGWEPTDDRPVEPNPTLAERPPEWWDPIPGPVQDKPVKAKSKRSSASEDNEDPEEGSDSVG
jgi:hypothetical protein